MRSSTVLRGVLVCCCFYCTVWGWFGFTPGCDGVWRMRLSMVLKGVLVCYVWCWFGFTPSNDGVWRVRLSMVLKGLLVRYQRDYSFTLLLPYCVVLVWLHFEQ